MIKIFRVVPLSKLHIMFRGDLMTQRKKKKKSNLFVGEIFFGTEDREKLFTEAVAPYYTPVKKEKNKKIKEA
ncbi:hypothetical protein [Bacillus safensis]|uniref:hypothetical protein n=2 Tax=Bacillales TaxID=1385 RepID=UPI000F51A7B2|nr:hypothetical protein [Bacillus safensis]